MFRKLKIRKGKVTRRMGQGKRLVVVCRDLHRCEEWFEKKTHEVSSHLDEKSLLT